MIKYKTPMIRNSCDVLIGPENEKRGGIQQ